MANARSSHRKRERRRRRKSLRSPHPEVHRTARRTTAARASVYEDGVVWQQELPSRGFTSPAKAGQPCLLYRTVVQVRVRATTSPGPADTKSPTGRVSTRSGAHRPSLRVAPQTLLSRTQTSPIVTAHWRSHSIRPPLCYTEGLDYASPMRSILTRLLALPEKNKSRTNTLFCEGFKCLHRIALSP